MAHEKNVTTTFKEKFPESPFDFAYNRIGTEHESTKHSQHPRHLNPRYMQKFDTIAEAEEEAQSISRSYDEPIDKQMNNLISHTGKNNEIIIRAKPGEYFTWEKEALARVMYGEASGEGDDGMLAVGNVVMNRLKSPKDWWGKSIESIISHPEQFSVFENKNDENYKRMMNATEQDKSFKRALEIAEELLTGKTKDNTGGATNFFNPNISSPPWATNPKMLFLKSIGNHDFYLEK